MWRDQGMNEDQVERFIRGLLEFPYPKICRHYVIQQMLMVLETNGNSLDTEFVNAVSSCDDNMALDIMDKARSWKESK